MIKFFHLYRFPKFLTAPETFSNIHIKRCKSVFGDKVTELDESTLTGRLLMYLSNCNISNVHANKPAQKLQQTNLLSTNLKHCNIEQIKSLTKSYDIRRKYGLLQTIDKECSVRVKQITTADIFDILHIFMMKLPNRIIECKFYESSMLELSSRLNYFNKNEIIQYIFYSGLRKKRSKNHDDVRKCLNSLIKCGLDTLTVEDLCIVCNSTFKTTTRIKSEEFCSKIVSYLHDNLKVFKDPAFLITLLKSVRQNRCQDEELLATISCTILFNKNVAHYSFSALCHILAVYSDFLYYDEPILKVFTETCIKLLKDSHYTTKNKHMSTQPRLKDIKRLLWCLSNLNYKGLELSDIKNVIIPSILQRVKAGDVEENYSSLVEVTLYLWMLNYRSYELLPYFLEKNIIHSINDLNTPLKQRLNLLITCIFYEEKELLKEIDNYPKPNVDYDVTKQLEKRPLLQKVIIILKAISKKHELNRFEVNCEIPGTTIIGVTGYKRNLYKTVYLEILDDYTTLKNTENLPTGPMQLKLRLLECLDQAVILVDSNEIGSMSDKDIEKVLLEEMEFVC